MADILSVAASIGHINAILKEIKALKRLATKRKRIIRETKEAIEYESLCSSSTHDSIPDSSSSKDSNAFGPPNLRQAPRWYPNFPTKTWLPHTVGSSEARSRKRRKLLERLRSIEEMKAQLYLDRRGSNNVKATEKSFRDAEYVANLLQSEDFRSVRSTLPSSMLLAISSGHSEAVNEFLDTGTELLHKPYMDRNLRIKLLSSSLPDSRMADHLMEGDVLHVPFCPTERRKFKRFVSSTDNPLANLDNIASQLPGRTLRDCRRFYLDEYEEQRQSSKVLPYPEALLRVTRKKWVFQRQSLVIASSASYAPRITSTALSPSLLSSVTGLILSRQHGRSNKSGSRLKAEFQTIGRVKWRRTERRITGEPAWLRATRHSIHRKLFTRMSTENSMYQENTGGSITDVKFGTHLNTKNKIIYGVTDTNALQCAVYDITTRKRTLLTGHTDAVEEVHITANNFITGSHDTNINIYSLEAELLWQFKEHKGKILSMAMHNVKPLFVSAAQHSPTLWLCNFFNKSTTSISLPLQKPTVSAGAMTFGNEGFSEVLAVGAQDESKKGTLSVYRVDISHAWLLDSFSTDNPVQCVARSPVCGPLSRKFVFSCSEEKLHFYDTKGQGSKKRSTIRINSEKLIRHASKQGVKHNIHDCSFSPNGMLLQSCGEDNTVIVHDVRKFDIPLYVLEHEYTGGQHGVACQWSSDSRFLATGADDCTVRIWDIGRGIDDTTNLRSQETKTGNVDEEFGFMNTEVNLIKHNQSGAICALSLSVGHDMVVAGSTSGRVVIHSLRSQQSSYY